MKDLSKEILAYTLQNALEYGNADAGRVLPKLFQHGLDKKEIPLAMKEINKTVEKVNSINPKEREKLFLSVEKFVKKHDRTETYELDELPTSPVGKKMVLRMAPFPSGALHLGNTKTFLLNALYAEKNNANLILIMDDTIGSAEKPLVKEAYDLISEAFKWLGVDYKKTYYKSDRLELYYEYAEKLIEMNKAYVCHCSVEFLRKNRADAKECSCRQFPKGIQHVRWKELFKPETAEGSAVLRIKTDMMHPNPAFRDRVLFKISDREHPRVGKKYRVWPTLEMSWAIDDHLLGITHIIRGNDLMIESDMERYIWDIFKWKHPEIFHAGFVNIEGAQLHKSKSAKEVNSGEFIGWDDPRTWSIQSLKRRGIRAEAIVEFIKEIGLNKHDITVPIDNLYSINRKMIDPNAERYSFLVEPVKLTIKNMPDWKEVEIPVHPDSKKTRKTELKDIYISKKDFESFKGKEIRLLHLFNVKLGKTAEVTDIDNKDIPKINWASDFIDAKVLMPDGTYISGIADSGVRGLKKGKVIQFERFAFVSFDGLKKDDGKESCEFWFAHK